MSNQVSTVPIGVDITVLAGYAQAVNERLGNIDFIIQNTGSYVSATDTKTATIKLMEYDGVTSPSGYKIIGTAFTVVAGGQKTVAANLLSKRVGFFGSGNTTVNISTVIRNPGDLSGKQIDIVVVGRRGYDWDAGADRKSMTPPWGKPPDRPDLPSNG